MKSSTLNIAVAVAAIAVTTVAAYGGSPTITAAAKAAPAPNKQKVEKTAVAQPAEASIARSEFTLPSKVTQGRDPFFPNSSRPYVSETVVKNTNASSVPEVEFLLKGISGSVEQPLAIINTTTFTTGEENEVIIKSKRIKLRCVEINMTAGTVLIEYAGSRRALKLQSH
jgi:hypothetical protein